MRPNISIMDAIEKLLNDGKVHTFELYSTVPVIGQVKKFATKEDDEGNEVIIGLRVKEKGVSDYVRFTDLKSIDGILFECYKKLNSAPNMNHLKAANNSWYFNKTMTRRTMMSRSPNRTMSKTRSRYPNKMMSRYPNRAQKQMVEGFKTLRI